MHFHRVPKTSWSVSCVTLGAALLPKTAADATATLRSSIESGINMIDLSATVLDGASEKVVGGELPALVSEMGIRRDELVLSSRLGVIPNKRVAQYKYDPSLQHMVRLVAHSILCSGRLTQSFIHDKDPH
jgi:aryl-alcohol dehydrogenase-like predicted oxidoreductase